MIIIVVIITVIALLTAIVAAIAAKDVIWDPKKAKWIKLKPHGYVFMICCILLVVLPVVQYVFQTRSDKKAENTRKTEQDRRDAAQRGEYQASVSRIRKDFGDSNNRTLTVIGQTLAIYKLKLDTTERKLSNLLRDSANIKTVLPDQPVLQVFNDLNGSLGIRFLKFEDDLNHYRINFVSQDGASCCYSLKISAVVADSNNISPTSFQMRYKGPIRMALTPTDNIAKNAAYYWTFTINNTPAYDYLFIWVRGTYGDRNDTHIYNIDKVYYNRKGANTSGAMGEEITNNVIQLVRRAEK